MELSMSVSYVNKIKWSKNGKNIIIIKKNREEWEWDIFFIARGQSLWTEVKH